MDYFSRWIEIAMLKVTTSDDVVSQLKSIFARYGIPDQTVLHNFVRSYLLNLLKLMAVLVFV